MAVTAGCGDDGPGDGDANVAEPEEREINGSSGDDEPEGTSDGTEETDEENASETGTEELTDDVDEEGSDDGDEGGETDSSEGGDDDSVTDEQGSTADDGNDDAESDGTDDTRDDTEDSEGESTDDGSDGEENDGGDTDDTDDSDDSGDGDRSDESGGEDEAPEDENGGDETEEAGDDGTDDETDGEGGDETDGDGEGEDENDSEDESEDEGESGDENDEEDTDDDEPVLDHPAAANMAHSPVLGPAPAEAPATIVMFDDPSCPACAYFDREVFPALEPHIEAGALSVVWRGIPVIEDWSREALEVMWATYERDVDAFWAVREHLFASQDSIDGGEAAIEEAAAYLETETSLDVAAIRADAERRRFDGRLARDETAAARAGLDATPYFYLFRDGEFRTEIRGAQDARVFASALEL